jgi:hypothetical protein
MATKKTVLQETTQKKPATAEPRDVYLIDGSELDSITSQLKEVMYLFIEAWATSDGLEHALVKLYAARRNLESAVQAEVQS